MNGALTVKTSSNWNRINNPQKHLTFQNQTPPAQIAGIKLESGKTFQLSVIFFYVASAHPARHIFLFNIRLLKLLGKDPSKYGKNKDIDLTQMAVDEFPVHARINYTEYKDKKAAAAGCHASQGGHGLTRGVMRWLSWLLGARSADQFMQAIPEPSPMSVKKDLFS